MDHHHVFVEITFIIFNYEERENINRNLGVTFYLIAISI
jgi:hypothetical protein